MPHFNFTNLYLIQNIRHCETAGNKMMHYKQNAPKNYPNEKNPRLRQTTLNGIEVNVKFYSEF